MDSPNDRNLIRECHQPGRSLTLVNLMAIPREKYSASFILLPGMQLAARFQRGKVKVGENGKDPVCKQYLECNDMSPAIAQIQSREAGSLWMKESYRPSTKRVMGARAGPILVQLETY